MEVKAWWCKYRTLVGAIAATLLMGVLVAFGHMQPVRVVIPLTIAWMLALHSADNRWMAERYELAIGVGMAGLARAGVDVRRGLRGDAAQDVAVAVEEVVSQLQTKDGCEPDVPEKQGS